MALQLASVFAAALLAFTLLAPISFAGKAHPAFILSSGRDACFRADQGVADCLCVEGIGPDRSSWSLAAS